MGSSGGPVGLPGEVLANGLDDVRPEASRKTYSDLVVLLVWFDIVQGWDGQWVLFAPL